MIDSIQAPRAVAGRAPARKRRGGEPAWLARFVAGWLIVLAGGWAQAAEPTLVDTATVDARRWQQTVPLYGTLTSPRDAEVTPRVAGLVASVAVDAGDRVQAGDTLIELDRTLESLTLATLEASAAEAEAQSKRSATAWAPARPITAARSGSPTISSMAAATDHIDHVRTQLPYALTGGAIAAVCFALLGATL